MFNLSFNLFAMISACFCFYFYFYLNLCEIELAIKVLTTNYLDFKFDSKNICS